MVTGDEAVAAVRAEGTYICVYVCAFGFNLVGLKATVRRWGGLLGGLLGGYR